METDLFKIENYETSPWSVQDLSEFLNYCCPECDFKDKNVQIFSDHAVGNHKDSNIFFGIENKLITSAENVNSKVYMSGNCNDNEDFFEEGYDNDIIETQDEVKIEGVEENDNEIEG